VAKYPVKRRVIVGLKVVSPRGSQSMGMSR
jgi:hypothetical protein